MAVEKTEILGCGGETNTAAEHGTAPEVGIVEVDSRQVARYKHELSEFKQSIIVIVVGLGIGLGFLLPGAIDGGMPLWLHQPFIFSGAWICLGTLWADILVDVEHSAVHS
uniref:Uncharacterized protein n=1 Tax=Leersia perrieri TaxID=77586 RepID=A0A0D9WAT1_9ORYZ